MDRLINRLAKLAIFKSDFDYHLMRASMVFIAFFFGYQKWFQYEADALIPYISHGPLIFWLYPVLRHSGSNLLLRCSRIVVWCAPVPGFLEQNIWDSRSSRFLPFDDLDLYHHPVDTRWVGSLCWRLSRYDRESCIPDEGSRDFRCIFLLAEAGRGQSVGLSQTSTRTGKAGGSLN